MPIKAQQKYAGASVMARRIGLTAYQRKGLSRPPVKIRIKASPIVSTKRKSFFPQVLPPSLL